jgi:hypothetical protein
MCRLQHVLVAHLGDLTDVVAGVEPSPGELVDRAARLSTRAGYAACDSEDIPNIRVVRIVRVLTTQFLAKYRLTDNHDAA